MPIYLVTVQGNPPTTKLVDAATKAAAINHVTRDLVSAAPLTATEVVAHMKGGADVEVVTSNPVEKQEDKIAQA